MSDAADRGITVTELAAMDQPIAALRETTAAFVGRALRGPLNEPVLINDFGEFRRRFGDVWSRSSLGPAAQQFFEHGGKNLYVVRVANSARGAMICLPASGSALVLRALQPGSTETLRAAVDYDGIDASSDELFNLTLQRVDPQSGLVLEQELFRHASFREDGEQSIIDRLLTSALARVERPLPTHRPESTFGVHTTFDIGYVGPSQQGTDGCELSDYDLIGSRKQETGLFALDQIDYFDMLYLPPPGKHRDLGPTAVLAAERYCRERGAMLMIDPLLAWQSAEDAASGARDLGYESSNLLSYFPRMYRRDDAAATPRAMGGAFAGVLCKLDRKHGAWQDLDRSGLGLSRDFVPTVDIEAIEAQRLARLGLNIITRGPAGSARICGSVTMGQSGGSQRQYASLAVRRTCLHIVHAIDAATRWAVFAADDGRLADHIRAQVSAYLIGLVEIGAFASEQIVVECDAGISKRSSRPGQGFSIFVRFQPLGSTKPIAFTIHQSIAGSRVSSTAFAPG